MLKSATTLLAALTVGWMLFGSATSASAHEDCEACKPTKEVHVKYREQAGKEITITHHKTVKERVRVRHTMVDITRIRPINRVHDVTIVDHYKVPVPYYVTERHDEWLPAKVLTDYHTINHYHGCGCGSH